MCNISKTVTVRVMDHRKT